MRWRELSGESIGGRALDGASPLAAVESIRLDFRQTGCIEPRFCEDYAIPATAAGDCSLSIVENAGS